ncbi:unnamed protein product [Bemisia tabaci]|uniref:DDE-1 domain-containing protein n=1 Tax=Bemisia tabaci TaxID=7038 RepID=A0A9P0A506_BEMTA|nr:unnamed protein product [Bemisia tabaci]
MKHNYRKSVVRLLLNFINLPEKPPSQELKIDMFTAMNYVANSWNSVTSSTIVNCFKKGGFQKQMFPRSVTGHFMTPEIAQLTEEEFKKVTAYFGSDVQLQEYLDIDANLATSGILTIGDLVEAHLGVSDTEGDGEEDLATPEQKLISTADAQLAVDNLRKFYCQCEGADSAKADF